MGTTHFRTYRLNGHIPDKAVNKAGALNLVRGQIAQDFPGKVVIEEIEFVNPDNDDDMVTFRIAD
jgi:hypothetical protein